MTDRFACIRCGFRPAGNQCDRCGRPLFDVSTDAGWRDVIATSKFVTREQWLGMAAGLAGIAVAIPVAVALGTPDAASLLIVACALTLYFAFVRIDRLVHPSYGAFAVQLRDARRRLVAPKKTIRTWALWGLAVFCLALYGVQRLADPGFTDALLLQPLDLRHGRRLHTLLTSMFLHASMMHVGLNCIGLVAFGRYVEQRAGRLATIALVVATGVAGGVAHGFLTSAPQEGLLGVSGAVFGLMGASLTLAPKRPMPFGQSGFVSILPAYIALPILVAFYSAADAAVHPDVAWLAHVGGFVAGVLFALPLRRIPTSAALAEIEAERVARLERLS